MSVQPRSATLPQEASVLARPASATAFAQRRAWVCIIAAFGIFCVLIGWLGYTANIWRKTAYSAPTAQLVSKRGIVLYQGPRDSLPLSVAEATTLEEGGTIEVPASSEAVIQLGVDRSSIRVRGGTKVRLTTMRIGRFNRDLTQVRLEQLQGAANYQVAGELPDGREVEIRTPHTAGSKEGIKLTKGDYLVWVQPETTRLLSYVGQAKAQIGEYVRRLRDAKGIAIGSQPPSEVRPFDLPEHLLSNRNFSKGLGEAWSPIDVGEKGRPDIGGVRSVVEETIEGRTVRTLRLTRDTAKDTHNETGLRQEVNREVWAYRNLTLSMLVKIHSASLDGGGYFGSEYPLMLRIHYIAENGGSYTWAHGFYISNPSNRPADIGEQITAGVWIPYRLDMMQLKDRPAYIGSIEVLASGHDFDSQVADIQLTAE
jgi:hypothetical protein